jgi:GT2 family glycosyltransferase/glycosyltransferase involved in cell wall biosynthesis
MIAKRKRVVVFSSDDASWACAQIRLLQPFGRLTNEFELVWACKPKTEGWYEYQLSLLEGADLVILQRYFVSEQQSVAIEQILNSGQPVVYETDDLPFGLPNGHPFSAVLQNDKEYVISVIQRVDAVIVSTPALARWMHVQCQPKSVYVLPNAVEVSLLHAPVRQRLEPIRIALAGTPTHDADYALLDEALEKVIKKYGKRINFVVIGRLPQRLRNYSNVMGIDFIPDYRLYAKYLPKFEFDIALVPLLDNTFNKVKSPIKWLEYSAAGIAGIFSDVEPYACVEHGVTGLKVPNTTEAWFDAICDLIDHPEKRLAIAKAAQHEVVSKYSTEIIAREYAKVYQSVLLASDNDMAEAKRATLKASEDTSCNKPVTQEHLYQLWQRAHQPQDRDAVWISERMAQFSSLPLFHLAVIVLEGSEEWLVNNINSLAYQYYPNWRLTIVAQSPMPDFFAGVGLVRWVQIQNENPIEVVNRVLIESDGDWVGMFEAGDRLAPHALFALADKSNRHSEWSVIYTDEDSLDHDGNRDNPFFKTDFNLEMLRAAPYVVGGLLMLKRRLFESIGGFRPAMEGVEYYDLVLRSWEVVRDTGIGHVADVLYHRFVAGGHCQRHPDETRASRRHALEEHLQRCGQKADLKDGLIPDTYNLHYIHPSSPLVSIIIPTRNQAGLLQRCLDTLIEKTAYQNYEIIVVDNGSDDADAVNYLNQLRRFAPSRLRVVDYDRPFNFAAMNNMAARMAQGDYLLLLNNDTAVLDADWLGVMLGFAQREDVGVVGARLLFPDSNIQHAGVILGINHSPAEHAFLGQAVDEYGYYGRLHLTQELSAVTAACLMVRKSLYDTVGGLDESLFEVSYNDVDLCLKIRALGYRVVWAPRATLLHEGSASQRGGVEKSADKIRTDRFKAEQDALYEKWRHQIAFDPAYNLNLSFADRNFSIEVSPHLTLDPEWRPRPRILAHPADRMGCGEYRIIAPMRALNADARVMGWETGTYLSTPELLRYEPDAIILQRQVEWSQIELIERYCRHSKAFRVFEIDDLITNVPIMSSRRKVFVEMKDLHKRFRKAVSLCHRFVVSTDYLAETYKGYTDEVVTVPNYIERARWGNVAEPLKRQGDKPRVGWAGSLTHDGDLAEIIDVVKATANEVQWVFLGMCPNEIKPLVEFHPPVPLDEYPAKLASLNLDLAVAPLEDVPFNHAKSHLRLLEYGILGYPVICTDITPYRGDYPVTRVQNRFKDWVEAIRSHVADLDELERQGQVLRGHIKKHWILEENLDVWLKAWLP